ncbi:sulfotransferase [Halovenus rubra]|uniref:Sulfotransferase n=2 Tax=Halovenus rubra TaxID=869890 RepID=A0ACC7DYA7_9EURY|nr:sulfotransferase [Halovenus rubra]
MSMLSRLAESLPLPQAGQELLENPQRTPALTRDRFTAARRISALPHLFEHRDDFDTVEAYCLFVGHGRTGHSLVGSLLNGHPEMVISHELDALRLLDRAQVPVSRDQLFSAILQRDDEFTNLGREWERYSYNVPETAQGEFDRLRIIGDKKGAASTRRLGTSPELLGDLRDTVSMPIRAVHVVRNPFDTIASRRKLKETWQEYGIEKYFANADNVELIDGMLDDDELFRLHHEDLISDTASVLSELCAFLGIDADDEYLSACEEFVFDSPNQTRHEVEWSDTDIDRISTKSQEYDWLEQYSFETE